LSLDEMRSRLLRALAAPPARAETSPAYAPQLAYGRHVGPAVIGSRYGAVLVLVYPHDGTWHVVLTERTSHLASHAGQVSFPGGRTEAGESPEQTALREYIEEMGSPGEIEVLGEMPTINVYASSFLVTPILAITHARPDFAPNPQEVAARRASDRARAAAVPGAASVV
jgi:8-oxo-dGTP pyrophosphatase MutT (NUDIX family)